MEKYILNLSFSSFIYKQQYTFQVMTLFLLPKKQISFQFFIFLICIAIFSFSCIPNKKLVYLPNPDFNENNLVNIANQPLEYELKPNDILSIKVKTLDAVSSEYFNIENENSFNINPASMFLTGYSIDNEGNIDIPEVGKVNVGGKSLKEAQEEIQQKLNVYLNNAHIIVKLVSFKITVLGEVQSPGHYFIYNEGATVLEGLGMAGDLTDFGNRENITLIRKTDNGSAVVLVNLKDPEFLSSEFYFLHPNDVLYIQPLKAKSSRSNLNTLTLLSVLFGAISSVVLLANYLK